METITAFRDLVQNGANLQPSLLCRSGIPNRLRWSSLIREPTSHLTVPATSIWMPPFFRFIVATFSPCFFGENNNFLRSRGQHAIHPLQRNNRDY